MTNMDKRLKTLEKKIQPENDIPVKVEYARDCVPVATMIKAAMQAIELGITIKDITGETT